MPITDAMDVIKEIAGNVAEPHRSYICLGTQLGANVGLMSAGKGVDLVWDLWNEQFSAFVFDWGSMSLSQSLGGSATSYVALGFGRFPNVHEAWRGEFKSISASVAVPELNWGKFGLSVGASGFANPDFSMVGSAATASFSAAFMTDWLGLIPATISFGVGDWSPFDALTQALNWWFPVRDIGGHKLIGLEAGVTGVARHMGFCFPMMLPPFPMLSAFATAVSISKSISVRW